MFRQALVVLIFATFVNAGFLNDKVYGLIPVDCTADCTNWVNGTTGCIEKTGKPLELSVDPSVGTIMMSNSNKLDMFLCLCNDNTKNIATSCFSCLSRVNCLPEPISPDNYNAVCSASEDGMVMITKALTSSCPAPL